MKRVYKLLSTIYTSAEKGARFIVTPQREIMQIQPERVIAQVEDSNWLKDEPNPFYVARILNTLTQIQNESMADWKGEVHQKLSGGQASSIPPISVSSLVEQLDKERH